jgi:hypothetical protein
MIKVECTLCGTVSRSAEVKTNKDGGKFIAFAVNFLAVGRNDKSTCNLEIHVSSDGDSQEASMFTTGRKVSVAGTLTIRKKGDNTYYNLRASGVPAIVPNSTEDSLKGTAHYEGKTSKKALEEKKDKKGRDFIGFSGWSKDKEKDSDSVAFIWFNFMCFHPTEEQKALIKPETYLAIDGDFEINSYKGKIDNNIRVHAVKPVEFPKDKKKEDK